MGPDGPTRADRRFPARQKDLDADAAHFKDPNDKQVLLNTNGSAQSVRPIPHHYAQTASSASAHAPYPAYVQDFKAQNAADSSSTSPALPIALGAGLLTAGTMTTVFALRRRRARAGTPTAAV